MSPGKAGMMLAGFSVLMRVIRSSNESAIRRLGNLLADAIKCEQGGTRSGGG
jgi:hypothetical protein